MYGALLTSENPVSGDPKVMSDISGLGTRTLKCSHQKTTPAGRGTFQRVGHSPRHMQAHILPPLMRAVHPKWARIDGSSVRCVTMFSTSSVARRRHRSHKLTS